MALKGPVQQVPGTVFGKVDSWKSENACRDWLLLHVAPCDSYAILGPSGAASGARASAHREI